MTGPKPNSKKLPLTFGIEVEVLYGIRRDLWSHYPEYYWLRPEFFTQEDTDTSNLGPESLKCLCPDCIPPNGLWQAARIFGRRGGELQIKIAAKQNDENFDKFSRWILTQECAVITPFTGRDLCKWSNAVLSEDEDVEAWDWTGLELISPALRVPDIDPQSFRPNGLVEVNGYLKFMTELPPKVPYIFMGNEECTSIHLHLGIQPEVEGQVDIPLNVLRHLAWVNILNAEHSRHEFHGCKLGKPFSPEDTFLKIFNYQHSDEENARRQLVNALSSKKTKAEGPITAADLSRYVFVNFENIANATSKESKRTIEFRQHHGTLNLEDINQWVVFVTALVRAAERLDSETPVGASVPPRLASKIFSKYKDPARRKQALQEAAKYAHILRQDQRSLKQLFDLLELPNDRRRYWWERAKTFRAELTKTWADKAQSICDNDWCPYPTIRDCEGWEEGELDIPPWDEAEIDEASKVTDSIAARAELTPKSQSPKLLQSSSARSPESDVDTISIHEEDAPYEDDVPMDIDNEVPEPGPSRKLPELSNSPSSNSHEDDAEDVPMDISDDDA